MSSFSERCELVPGYAVNRCIHGCWQLAEGHGAVSAQRESLIADLVERSLEGTSTFDCADIYTGVEELLGEVRRRVVAAGATPPQIHTKFVPDLAELPTISRADVEAAIDRSLARLGVECLDLVQLHWWDLAVPRFVEVGTWLTELREAGKIRQLGVTNFGSTALGELLDAGVPIISNQVQYSLLDRRPAAALAQLCRMRGVQLLAYGTVAGGFLGEHWLGQPAPDEPLANRSLIKYRLMIDEAGGWAGYQRLLWMLAETARRHDVSAAAVAARWALEQRQVAAVIVGLRPGRPSLLREMLRFDLSNEEMTAFDGVLRALSSPPGGVYEREREREGKHGRIMKYDLRQKGDKRAEPTPRR